MEPVVIQLVNLFVALVLSLSFHEAAHAWVAKICGDSTAESEGRLTLNPGPHIDPVGTLLFPLVGMGSMLLMGLALPLFGWAKPVPVDLNQLHNRKWGHFFVAAAGPVSNLLLCALGVIVSVVIVANFGAPEDGTVASGILIFTQAMIGINALLAFFNLIPIPPLDGGTVLGALLPGDLGERYEQMIAPYGMMILIMLMLSGSLQLIRVLSDGYTDMLTNVFVSLLL